MAVNGTGVWKSYKSLLNTVIFHDAILQYEGSEWWFIVWKKNSSAVMIIVESCSICQTEQSKSRTNSSVSSENYWMQHPTSVYAKVLEAEIAMLIMYHILT